MIYCANLGVILLDNEARLVYDKVRGKDWRFNLQQGARAVDVEDEGLRKYLVELAQRAARDARVEVL